MTLAPIITPSFSAVKVERIEDLNPYYEYLQILVDDSRVNPCGLPKLDDRSDVGELVKKFEPLGIKETNREDCPIYDQPDDSLSEDSDSDWYDSGDETDQPTPGFAPFSKGSDSTFKLGSEVERLLNPQFFLGYGNRLIAHVYCWGIDPKYSEVTHIYRIDGDGTCRLHTSFHHSLDIEHTEYRQALGHYFCWINKRIYCLALDLDQPYEPSVVYTKVDLAFQAVEEHLNLLSLFDESHANRPQSEPSVSSYPIDHESIGQPDSDSQQLSVQPFEQRPPSSDEAPNTVVARILPDPSDDPQRVNPAPLSKSPGLCPPSASHLNPLRSMLSSGISGVEPAASSPSDRDSSLEPDPPHGGNSSIKSKSTSSKASVSSASGCVRRTRIKYSRKLPGKFFSDYVGEGLERLKEIIDRWVSEAAGAILKCPEPREVCGSKSRRPHALKTHLYSHYNIRPFICQWPGCQSKPFLTSSGVKKHRHSFHACPGCNAELPRAKLQTHKKACEKLASKRSSGQDNGIA